MDAAALLLVSAVGVAFGWQPMPDGSQRYEYIVQLEPELAQTLAEGRSIPIVSDVPPEVQPIGRIRVVVGREEPPRQRLVTRLKPAAGPQDSAIELAQYSRYADERYSTAPPQQPPATTPSSDRVAAATHPYATGQSQPQPGAGETAWNSAQQDESPITPTDSTPSPQQLFGGASGTGNAWNADAAIDSAASAAAQAASQLGNQLQQSAQPLIQKGTQQLDSQVQAAADKFDDRTRGLLNELRQPFQQPQQQATANGQQPPASATTSAAGEQAWNQDQQDNSQAAMPNPLRGDQQVGSSWNNEQPQSAQTDPRNAATSPSNTGQAPRPGAASIHWNPSAGSQAAGSDRGTAAPQQPGEDPWAGVPDPRTQAGAGGTNGASSGIPGVATRPLPYGGLGSIGTATGPEFPNLQNPTPSSQTPGQTAAAQSGTGSPTTTGAAQVRSDMLQQPSDRPLDGAATPVATNPAPTTAGTAPATTTWGSPAQPPTAANSAATANTPTSGAPAADSAERASSHAAMVLFAWVMLTGSVAGNFYLFWSYLDVRQKYRSLVRKTARAVGSRFSAA
jgi:hypothetical protein